MTRAQSMKYFMLPAVLAVAAAVGTPAFALNPQPLPPGYQNYSGAKFAATGRSVTPYCVSGSHRGR